ncbi:MAG: hypothetical protein FJ293_06585 [Planctomycetes bacterium]|nr:hypothetical protein [Planctomycetota bacterium]
MQPPHSPRHRHAAWRHGRRFVACAAALFAVSATAPHAPAHPGPQDCRIDSFGQLALDELGAGDYRRIEGGLYPGAVNDCPPDHLDGGKHEGSRVVPRLKNGTPHPSGQIGVAAIGFSFTSSVFDRMAELADGDAALTGALAFANCCQGSADLTELRDPANAYWTDTVPDRLDRAGVDARQVQVVWMLEGVSDRYETFPDHVATTADWYTEVLQILTATFPNLRQCWLTPLHWQGWSFSTPSEEPYYFEQGFAVREVIARQIAGAPELAWDRRRGSVVAPWIAWGPYLWCDGSEPRVDGLAMACADYQDDGSHLSPAGNDKLARRLLHHWKGHPACTPWALADGSGGAGRMAAVNRLGEGTRGRYGQPRLSASALPTVPSAEPYLLRIRHSVRNGYGWLLLGDSLLPGEGVPFAGGYFRIDPIASWQLPLDGLGNGAIDLGEIPDDPALAGVAYYAQFIAIDREGEDGRHALSAPLELRLGD